MYFDVCASFTEQQSKTSWCPTGKSDRFPHTCSYLSWVGQTLDSYLPMNGCTNHFSFSIQNGYKEKGFRRVQENQLVKTMSNIYWPDWWKPRQRTIPVQKPFLSGSLPCNCCLRLGLLSMLLLSMGFIRTERGQNWPNAHRDQCEDTVRRGRIMEKTELSPRDG